MNIVEKLERHICDMSDDECWVTDYKPRPNGYVQVQVPTTSRSTRYLRYVHVLAWEIHNAEPVPKGMVVMHSCDNRACCNPNHLSLGTQLENVHDCIEKGRAWHCK